MASWLRALVLLTIGCSASSPGQPADRDGSSGGGTLAEASGGTVPVVPIDPATPSGGAPAGGGVGGSGTGVGGSASGGSQATMPPMYDPNVRFEWEETDPNALPPCLAGRYVGTFAGFYNLLIPVAGDIDMTLTESASGEFLEVTGGSMSGVANLTIPFSADVTGRLDCATKRFVAQLENGVYDAFGAQATFEGPLEADYDTATHQMVAGTWTVTEPNPANGGTGDWNATYTP